MKLVFSVQSNKIVDIDYSDDGFVKGKTKYKLKIDEKNRRIEGYFTERNRRHGADVVSLRWQLKVFLSGLILLETLAVYLTQYNGQTPESMLKIGTGAFESP